MTPHTVNRKKRGKVDYYYRCLGYWHEGTCANKKHHQAEDLELRVAAGVASLFRDRDRLLSHIDERVRQVTQSNPEGEAKAWAERIAGLDRKLSRAQDVAIEGLISHDDLRERLVGIRCYKEAAARELEAAKNKKKHIEKLKSHRRYLRGRSRVGLPVFPTGRAAQDSQEARSDGPRSPGRHAGDRGHVRRQCAAERRHGRILLLRVGTSHVYHPLPRRRPAASYRQHSAR